MSWRSANTNKKTEHIGSVKKDSELTETRLEIVTDTRLDLVV